MLILLLHPLLAYRHGKKSAQEGHMQHEQSPFSLLHHETFEMTREIIQEVYNVSNAMNLDLEKNIVNSTMNQLKKNSRNIQSSMQTDLFKGKKIEVDYLNGAVFKFGKKYGIKTPINEYIFRTLSLHNA